MRFWINFRLIVREKTEGGAKSFGKIVILFTHMGMEAVLEV